MTASTNYRPASPPPAGQPGGLARWVAGVVASLKTIPLVSCLVLGMGLGCATKPSPLVVAYGHLLSQSSDSQLSQARYGVSTVQRGTLPTNEVEVLFWGKSQTGDLPQQAILLLSRPLCVSPPIWYAVGEDAGRGILSDTPAARRRVESLPNARILDSPRLEWLPRAKAELKAREFLVKEGFDPANLRLDLRRAQFGWKAWLTIVVNGEYLVGGHGSLGIRDSGDVLYWIPGL